MRWRSNHIVFRVLLLLLLAFSCKQKHPESDKNANSTLNYGWFKNPPNQFRSHPFYSINDSLTEEEISWQIKDFKQAGFGGFYLHSRSGLITEFLGEDWWKIMQAAVGAANMVDLRCMFYDEDKWPSGYAGGIVPRMSEDYRAKCLARLKKTTPLPIGAEIIAEDKNTNYVLYTAQFGYDIFNGTCYVDLFNPEAVQAFIDVSYRPYAEKYRDQIKSYRPAIFSDEPHVHARYFDRKTPNLGTLSYSPWLEKKFTELYGYDLRDKIELLYEEKDNWREVRMQYYRAKALLFEESYTKQLAEFCGNNSMDYTGHYLAEDVLEKVRDRAANTMLHYRSMQQPGMDNLGLGFKNKEITARNLSSVANQFGKQKRLSELFGISGQNMNFEDQKWIAGWHAIMGVNHFCPHLTLYSMKGHRKRDYPPTFSYQQPYWHFNKKLEDYLGRIAYAASVGQYDPQVLVISPLESEYIKKKDDGEFSSGMLEVLKSLQTCHFDYDVGDEQIIADTAFVKDGHLVIGEMNYRHIVLPDMISIRQSTIDLIKELHTEGGLVFSTGRFPRFIDGKEAPEELEVFKKTVQLAGDNDFAELILKNVKPNVEVSGRDAPSIWTQTRTVDGGKLINLFNTSHTDRANVLIKADFPGGDVVLWDPSTLACYRLTSDDAGSYSISLDPSSNIWITSGSLNNDAKITGEYHTSKSKNDLLVLNGKWIGQRLDPNALTLDFARYSTNGNDFSRQAEPVIGIFSRLADQNYSGPLVLDFPFSVEEVPSNCSLVIEQPEMYRQIGINCRQIEFQDQGFYIDHYFRKTELTNFIKKGQNVIQLTLDFRAPQPLSSDPKSRYGSEIESIYLIGDFAVKGNPVGTFWNTQRNLSGNFIERPVFRYNGFGIAAEQNEFDGELTDYGYPFYAGRFELSQSFELKKLRKDQDYVIELTNCEAIAGVIELNGETVDTLVWAPFTADISDYLIEGENTVKITLVNSLRNLLGPHHHKEGELIRVGPNSFTGAGGFPDGKGQRNWYDTRLTGDSNPIWTDTYMNIPFGFVEPVKISISKK